MFKGTSFAKLKSNLKLSISRFKLLEKKKTEQATKARKDIADYISGGKDDRARIRVEHIIREDYIVEAYEMLEMYCDLLLARFGLIEKMKELDPGIEEAVATLIWAAPRIYSDVPEMKVIADQFLHKYGKEFFEKCRDNVNANVNDKVRHRLSIGPPPKVLIEQYMMEIAKNFKVPFEPDPSIMLEANGMVAHDLIDLGNRPGPSGGGASGGYGGGNGGYGGGGGGMAFPPMPAQQPHMHQPPVMEEKPPWYNPNAEAAAPESKPFQYPSNPSAPTVSFYTPVGPPPPTYSAVAPKSKKRESPPPGADLPDLPSVPTNFPAKSSDSSGSGGEKPPGGGGGEDVDFDDLTRRFEELKRRK